MTTRESSAKRGYGGRWQKARATYLAKHPLCVECDRQGRVALATVVDHIQPHRGNQARFWDVGNWQSLCKHCHDSHKQRQERSGAVIGCDTTGQPLDPAHHWNTPGPSNGRGVEIPHPQKP